MRLSRVLLYLGVSSFVRAYGETNAYPTGLDNNGSAPLAPSTSASSSSASMAIQSPTPSEIVAPEDDSDYNGGGPRDDSNSVSYRKGGFGM
ncbi:hypothetical protein PRK78_000011 [Emydomyces testavorans]|uniref:Uncharacterized protein n=1 Tax=Emydomyces testavorans TaxID=2070801 RepID=A0AAF0DAW3_9EURO|nr:hypothetical protein PRK78_000011 [Emydomyces testavorans]